VSCARAEPGVRYECPALPGCSWSEADGDVCAEGRYTRSACGVGEILQLAPKRKRGPKATRQARVRLRGAL
jgi:hypothetical protein